MDNKFENHVKSDKVKWVVVFLAIILLAVGLLSVSTDGFKAFKRDKSPVDSTEVPVEDEGGESVLTEGTSSGMKLAGAKLTSEKYESNGVSEQANSVYTLTTTVTPANGTLKIQYTYSYRGSIYGSSSVSTGIAFDASGIVTVAETLGVDYEEIIF